MKMPRFTFSALTSLLGQSVMTKSVREMFHPDLGNMEKDEYYGSLQFKTEGIEVVFREAPWVIPSSEISNPHLLYVSAIHFHRMGHEGYSGFLGQFPGDILFNDSESTLKVKLGSPAGAGGGSFSAIFKKVTPRWIKYPLGNFVLHLQLDDESNLEMVTLFVPKPETNPC